MFGFGMLLLGWARAGLWGKIFFEGSFLFSFSRRKVPFTVDGSLWSQGGVNSNLVGTISPPLIEKGLRYLTESGDTGDCPLLTPGSDSLG